MKSKNIEQMSHAINMLRQFIVISSKLLPFLSQLNKNGHPSPIELADKVKIISIYNEYNFDIDTSTLLFDSPILELVHVCFEKLIQKEDATFELELFTKEFNRLQKNWGIIDAN
ncbi:MAG: hypothetical protein KJ941_12930 [Bacteroidetes bacterium]|nr:hypothetical protein [Bacteroidota bacterium]